MEDLIKNFRNIQKKYNEEKVRAANQLSDGIHEYLKPIFEQYPNIDNLAFTAYTPYFNDGDVCTYSVHSYEDSIYVNHANCYDNEWSDEYKDASQQFSNIIQSIPEELIENAYEEGKTIFFRDGTVSHEEVDHE